MLIQNQSRNQASKKSQIKFIRNLAVPKTSTPYKSYSTSNIPYIQTSPQYQLPYSISITLTLIDKSILNLTYHYSQHTKVSQFIVYLKQKLGMENVYFTSGNIMLDYFITLNNRYLCEINMNKLMLQVKQVQISEVIQLKNLEILKCIGSGGFSKVLLARVYGILVAIKMISKQFIFKTAKHTIVQNQKYILQQCQGHPFITKLYFSLQTTNYIVLGMQYCPGGELFNLLRKVKRMPEGDAKFYFIQTLLAIQHLHNKGILYRDLKPQNIIIDADGHVKLADFGLSKVIGRNITYSFCGSAEYMSPQMLLKKGHSYQVDYYCLGALLYQLVTGLPPFYSSNQSQLFNSILHSNLTFPPHLNLSQGIKQFLYKILQKQPQKRFQNITQIIHDPWVYSDFNKQLILSKKLLPPYPTSIFNYNFDDTQFSNQQQTIIKLIQDQTYNEKYKNKQDKKFINFYYEAQQISKIKKEIQENYYKNFNKNKNFKRNQIYLGKQRRRDSLLRPTVQISHSTHKIDVKEYRQSNNSSMSSSIINSPLLTTKHQARSSQNLKSLNNSNSHSHSTQKISYQNLQSIYTNKQKLPISNLLRTPKLQNSIYNHQISYFSQKSLDTKYKDKYNNKYKTNNIYNTSLQRQKQLFETLNINMNSHIKNKSSSLDKGYHINKKKPMELNYYGKNYMNQLQNKSNQNHGKIRKSVRNGEKINFYNGDKINFYYSSLKR